MFKMQKDMQESIFAPEKCSCGGYAGNINYDDGLPFELQR